MDIFFQVNPGAFIATVLLALLLTTWQWLSRTRRYLETAARYAGYQLEAYGRMLVRDSENSDVIFWGIDRHQTRLLQRWNHLLARVHYFDPHVLIDTREGMENIFNHFVFAYWMRDPDVGELHKEMRWLCQRLSDLRHNYLLSSELQADLRRGVREIEEWEAITRYLLLRLQQPARHDL